MKLRTHIKTARWIKSLTIVVTIFILTVSAENIHSISNRNLSSYTEKNILNLFTRNILTEH